MAGITALAQELQNKGRGYDSHLVHMSTKELQGLQALAQQHGGSLTLNPKTGLYEAGFLENILPMAATAVASYFGGPWAGAAVGGALGAARNKSNPLLGAGLGALGGYGMGSLADMFVNAGMTEGAASTLAEQMASTEGSNLLGQAAMAGSEFAPVSGAGLAPTQLLAREAAAFPLVPGAGASTAAPAALEGASAFNGPVSMTQVPPTRWDAFTKGISALPTNPTEENKKYMKPALLAGVGMLGAYSANNANQNNAIPPGTAPATIPGYTYHPPVWNAQTGRYENPAQSYTMAGGGTVGMAGGGQALPSRMLKGPGTGLSDDIPAQIDGGKPAALADGEFVVSADVVSALGGGSTDSGARKLYAMMDRVRRQAHGNKKQIRKVNEKKAMPA